MACLLFDKLYNTIIIFNCFVTKLLSVSELPQKKQNNQVVSNIYSLCCNTTAPTEFFFCWVQRSVWAKCLRNQSAKRHTTNSPNMYRKAFGKFLSFLKNYLFKFLEDILITYLVKLRPGMSYGTEKEKIHSPKSPTSCNTMYSYHRHVSQKCLCFAIMAHRALKMCTQISVLDQHSFGCILKFCLHMNSAYWWGFSQYDFFFLFWLPLSSLLFPDSSTS